MKDTIAPLSVIVAVGIFCTTAIDIIQPVDAKAAVDLDQISEPKAPMTACQDGNNVN